MPTQLFEIAMELLNVEQMVAIFRQMPKTPETSGALSRLYRTRQKLVRQIMQYHIHEALPGYWAEIDRLRKSIDITT